MGIAMPYRHAVLSVALRGRIDRMVAAEGTMVRQGDLVFALVDGVQQARTAIAEAAASSTLEIDLAKARWAKAKRDFDRLSRLYGNDSATSKELSDAVADEEISRIEYELAHFDHAQAQIALQREREMLAEFRVHAPFDGYVAQHLKQVGEAVELGEGVVKVAQLDPLEVAVDCPLAAARMLATGGKVRVTPIDPQLQERMGTVRLVNRVADGASQTVKVKIRVDNADGAWPAGLRVKVALPTGDTQDAERHARNATGHSAQK